MPQLRASACTVLALLLVAASFPWVQAQGTLSTLGGVVTDPSGAVIPNATLTLHSSLPPVPDRTSSTTHSGRYAFAAPPGDYTVTAAAPGFAPSTALSFHLDPGTPQTLDIRLRIPPEIQRIEVPDLPAPTDPAKNGDSITLRGRAVDDLPLDSSQMLQQLQALAGSTSPEIYLNGFSGGTLPSRDTIREIRINQNPYSAQNDTNPVNGRIEVFTKPGTDHFHGDIYALGNDSALNSLSPFVTAQTPYYSFEYFLTLSGPLTRRSSFFTNGGRRTNQTQSIVDAQVLDSSLNQINFRQAVPNSSTTDRFSARVDAAPGAKNTVTLQYNLFQTHDSAAGIGELALATQGYDNHSTAQTLQVSDTQIVTPKIVNDARFQYIRSRVRQIPVSDAPTIIVQGAFNGGGSSGGAYHDKQDRYELQNYTSTALGKHFLNFGVRLRDTRDSNRSSANYNGEFIFSDLEAYEYTLQCILIGLPAAQIRASGGGASQFKITAGSPGVAVNVFDSAVFLQDDWKTRPNLTLSAGLRYETQNIIHDRTDFGPRLGFVYSFREHTGKDGKKIASPYTLRGGSGIFFRRFTSGYVLEAARLNGVTQQQYVVDNPNFFPNIPSVSSLGSAASSTTYQVSPAFHAPYFLSSTLSLDRRLGNFGILTLTFYDNRGVHTQLTRNVNAPLPGTYNPAVSTGGGIRPYGGTQNIYQYDSAGLYRDNRLSVNINAHYKSHLYLYGYYQFRHANTDDNAGGFISNQYNLRQDYGRVPNTPTHQFNGGAAFDLPFGLSQYLFLRASSGLPFNIVLPNDLNGDSQFNDRPTFATDLSRPSVVNTSFGTFDTVPVPGQTTIPFDYGTGPGLFNLYLSVARDFHFGPELKAVPGSPAARLAPGEKPHIDRRYTLNLAITADNALNHPNYAPPVGTLTSPLFGRSVALAPGSSSSANRVVSFQTFLRF